MAKLDLNLMPPLTVVSQIEYEDIIKAMGEVGNLSTMNPSNPAYRAMLAGAYREQLLRQDADDQVRAVMLASSWGAALDHIGVTYYRGVDGSPVVRLEGESDDDYRIRLHESPAGLSTAGPAAAYEFHSKTAHPNIKQALCTSPGVAQITMYVLGRDGNGVVPEGQLKVVDTYLWPRRPLTDKVLVKSAKIVEYTVRATLIQAKNPDYESVMRSAEENLKRFVDLQHRFRAKVMTSALHSVLMVYGVTEVRLEGWKDIITAQTEAPFCAGIELSFGGWDDEWGEAASE